MKSILISILFFFALTPLISHGEEINAGFVQGIWFGDKAVFADVPIRIYVALRNSADHDLTGTVRFADNEKRVGTSYVSALPGRLVEAWVDWTPTYGEHIVVATLSNTQIHPLGEDAEIIEVVSAQAEQTIFVDRDTDKDSVGDKDDTDDDGDSVSDADEVARGTDPLVNNKPKEEAGTSDKEDTKTEDSPAREKSTTESENKNTATESSSKAGLEQYIENETVNKVLSNVTDKVNETKQSIDTYRATRKDDMDTYMNDHEQSSTSTEIMTTGSSLGGTSTSFGTITRSKMVQKSFFDRSIESGKAILSWLYSGVLFILSQIFAHPALVQLALLLFILFGTYSFARKLARRPKQFRK